MTNQEILEAIESMSLLQVKELVDELKEKYPEQVRIIKEPEDNDGCIYAEIPFEWFKLSPKKVVSEEQKEKSRVRMKQMQADGLIHVQNMAK